MSKLLTERSFWLSVWAVVVGVYAHAPAVRQLVSGLWRRVDAWGAKRAPAWIWSVVEREAPNAVRGAYQRGQAYNWSGAQKMDQAISYIEAVLASHGVSAKHMPAPRAVEGLLESVWNQIKASMTPVTPAAKPETSRNPISDLMGLSDAVAPAAAPAATPVAAPVA